MGFSSMDLRIYGRKGRVAAGSAATESGIPRTHTFISPDQFVGFVEFIGFVGLKTQSAVESLESKTVKEKEACPCFPMLHTIYVILPLTSGARPDATNGLRTDG